MVESSSSTAPGWVQLNHEFMQSELELYLEARTARRQAVSWRKPPFRVGAAGLIVIHTPELQYRRASGANHKPKKNGGERFCAEERVMDRAREHPGAFIAGLVVAGDHQPDDHSGVDLGVLIPCVHCRRKFALSIEEKDGIIRPETRLVLSNVITYANVRMTVEHLLRSYPVDP